MTRNPIAAALSLALIACSGSQDTTLDAAASVSSDAAMDVDATPEPDAMPPVDASTALSVGINELLKNSPGPDDDLEFIEVFGPASTDLSGYWLAVVEGDADSASSIGSVDMLIQVGITDEIGLWVTPFMGDEVPNGSSTFLLVRDINVAQLTVDADLDVDDDGALDLTPWVELADAVAMIDDPEDTGYAAVLLSDDADGLNTEFVGAARFPDGGTSGALGGWVRCNGEGDGLQGIPGKSGATCNTCGEVAAPSGQALLTPGTSNQLAP
jgi:hypothetical protein